jgi:phosphotransferase system HPr-like phosphotransfer protein
MVISKTESERILKAQGQSNKVSAVTLRKNDTAANKKTELRSMTSLLESKINQGKEVTLIVVESH